MNKRVRISKSTSEKIIKIQNSFLNEKGFKVTRSSIVNKSILEAFNEKDTFINSKTYVDWSIQTSFILEDKTVVTPELLSVEYDKIKEYYKVKTGKSISLAQIINISISKLK